MALLIEQSISCLSDWAAYDSKLSLLSAQESTPVEKKAELAQQEVQTEVLAFLVRNTTLSDAHVRSTLKQIHVSEPLKRWHVMQTLNLYYSDLASLQGSVLHREQSRLFEIRADEARDQAFATGLGIVSNPVPIGERPEVFAPAEIDPNRLMRGRVRFVNAAGAEGTVSPEFPVPVASSGTTVLQFVELPEGVTSWRLYLAEDSDEFRSLAVAGFLAGESVSVGSTYALLGPTLDSGAQAPDRFIHYARNTGR